MLFTFVFIFSTKELLFLSSLLFFHIRLGKSMIFDCFSPVYFTVQTHSRPKHEERATIEAPTANTNKIFFITF